MSPDQKSPPTTDKLRHEIDRGQTGDKVDWPDPAAAPLGTDDEASGNPATPQELELDQVATAERSPRRISWGAILTYIGFAVAVLTFIVIVVVYSA